MKPLILSLFFISIIFSTCFATIRTVSNDTQKPAQFTTIQAAINASSLGDTVYVSGSSFDYSGAVSINKRIVLLGAGYNSANQLNLSSIIAGSISLTKDATNDASGTVISGFRVGFINTTVNQPVNNILLFRNQITSGITIYGDGWSIINNIVGLDITSLSGIASNVLIQNDILLRSIVSLNQSSVIIDHNIFLRNSNSYMLGNLKFAVITNNIFVGITSVNPILQAVSSNSFNNNLTSATIVSDTAPTNSFAGGPNSATGNFVGVDPLFVNVTDFSTYNANFNYRLQSSSPAKNAGTDGTDLGIYGGPFPFPSGGAPGSGFDTSAPPPIPQVTNVNIQNPSLAPGAQLKVTIQATVNN
jgi:hypothetical protein